MLDKLEKLNVFHGPGGRALNKPLLLLQAIGDVLSGRPRLQSFSAMEPTHRAALLRFSLNKRSPNPAYAFWRLQSEGVWQIESDGILTPRSSNSDPTAAELRRKNGRGGFTRHDYDSLRNNAAFAEQAVETLLSQYFPYHLRSDIRDYFGLRAAEISTFQKNVLAAYKNVCAITRLGSLLGTSPLGVVAVPIRWPSTHAPLTVNNGIALSSHLASAFLTGGFTIVQQGLIYRVLKSSKLKLAVKDGTKMVHGGERVSVPSSADLIPSAGFLNWHRRYVFAE
jgi:putative restriction endonuclease